MATLRCCNVDVLDIEKSHFVTVVSLMTSIVIVIKLSRATSLALFSYCD